MLYSIRALVDRLIVVLSPFGAHLLGVGVCNGTKDVMTDVPPTLEALGV